MALIAARSAGGSGATGAAAAVPASASASDGGGHASLTLFLKLTAADWRSSTGASVAMS